MMDKNSLYLQMLRKLLPKGKAFRQAEDALLVKLLQGMADEFVRVDDRAEALILESDPRTTYELLEDWERICGLPDDCTGLAPTIAERRAQVVARLILRGSQSRAFLAELASKLGYSITATDLEEFAEFKAGISRAGDSLTNGEWVHTFAVNAPANTTRYFKAGAGAAGEALAEFGDDVLECVITHNKPAHSYVIFKYS
jgi:uncharacterized protein YmfQ (DUF2313 family)